MGAGKLIALAAVELVIDGVALTLHGLQMQRGLQAGAEATAVTLPRYRTPSGDWRSAITLPDELRRLPRGRPGARALPRRGSTMKAQ